MNSRNDTEFDEDVTFVDVPSDSDADPLALFESESDPDQGDGPVPLESKRASPAASLTRARRPMALDQVLHRLGSVAWAEAVAIVEGLCEVLISGGRERVPEVSRIAITAAGGVAVGTGGVKDAAGPILARMIHTLTATGSIPAPLRLLVTRWTSAGDEHTIAEFAKELGYFARPDGQNLIQAVYERAVATVPVRPTPRQEVPRPVPPVRPPQARDSRFLYFAVAAAGLLVISLTGLVALRGTGSTRASSTPSSTATTAQSDGLAAGTNPPSVAGPGRQRGIGTGTRAAAATPGTADRGTTPVMPVSPRGNAPGAPPAPVSSAVRATLASPAAASPRSAPIPPSSGAVASSRSALEATPIYSRRDPNVTPPALLHAQLPSPLLSGFQPDMNTIELIVSETGSVERVRLLSTPKRMPDMMLLSNAKNWEFEPAVKDGQAVRYRLELSWTATP
jgi:hypothetical protein